MKKSLLFRILIITSVVTLVFAYTTTAFSIGTIVGVEYSKNGIVQFGSPITLQASINVTQAMSPPDGELYSTASKAVALRDAVFDEPIYNYCDRVRVYPFYSSSDLRIDPNPLDNWVGRGQKNYSKQVKGVQTILFEMGYLGDAISNIDGICGNQTITGIGDFQKAHNILPADGIAGPVTWRALCSSATFKYGYTGY